MYAIVEHCVVGGTYVHVGEHARAHADARRVCALPSVRWPGGACWGTEWVAGESS